MKEYGKVGIIGRFKPLHNGHASMLEAACERAEHVVIGIGSSNRYNMRNPFTAEESQDMVNLVLKPRFSNYEMILVPDFGHIEGYGDGSVWRDFVVREFGHIDRFITGDGYVAELLGSNYEIIDPVSMIPEEMRQQEKGSLVRAEMVQGECYVKLVPAHVAEYLRLNGLVERFRREFGDDTITRLSRPGYDPAKKEDAEAERMYVSGQ